MSRLDDELRIALRREDPPPGFAERVLARTSRSRLRAWWVAVAAALLVTAAGEFEYQRRVRAEGELAKEKVMLALRITGSKLQFVKEKINGTDSKRQ